MILLTCAVVFGRAACADEYLNAHWFILREDAKDKVELWRQAYREVTNIPKNVSIASSISLNLSMLKKKISG
ncbi:hypothetical protein CWM47_22785 [Spirosoma pollinicola]|uniref:Uncharacterized protein n=1 Tax=Spirosoma pollinicola TaxID=2057025 RepID=A0A2K8Z3H3_9BACT|nr:hypothetical protein CWM47_22785 [Spirosoma pollinicola]